MLANDIQSKHVVYLLDEPGVSLHVNAQRELLDLFRDLASKGNQVVYSTHSPTMLDTSNEGLHRIRAVVKDAAGYTRIYKTPYDKGISVTDDLLKAFKTFFNYLKREGHIQENPTAKVKNMKQPKTKILTFSEDEIRRLLNHFGGKNYLSLRNRAILAMFFDTGMRLTEVITLKPEQIHDEYILVHGKGSKERVVPVSPYLAKVLMKYRMAREASPGRKRRKIIVNGMNGY